MRYTNSSYIYIPQYVRYTNSSYIYIPQYVRYKANCNFSVRCDNFFLPACIAKVCYYYLFTLHQGTNARKVISEVCAFFVLQCTVFGRKSKHKTDVRAWDGISFHKNNPWNILVIGKYYVNDQHYQNSMRLTYSDTRRTLMHLFLFTNSAQRELVSICTQSIHDRNWLSLY